MKFPSLVYKCPGRYLCPGGTYTYVPVRNEEELQQRLSEGYHETMPQAMGTEEPKKVVEPVKSTEDDDSPPTREELEQKAAELGIKVQKNMKDKVLLNKINKALDKE